MNDKVVVVTGAGSGSGRATARAFAAQGAKVVLVGRRLAETGVGEPLAEDVAEADRIVEFVQSRYGRLDVLVNNAASMRGGPLGTVTSTDVVAPILLTQAALPLLKESRGVVVNVSTAIGQRGWDMRPTRGSAGGHRVHRERTLPIGRDRPLTSGAWPAQCLERRARDIAIVVNDALRTFNAMRASFGTALMARARRSQCDELAAPLRRRRAPDLSRQTVWVARPLAADVSRVSLDAERPEGCRHGTGLGRGGARKESFLAPPPARTAREAGFARPGHA
ncbi:SDR family NAD(P)-dependent oxidoreductase [Actinophytocola sp.]|uniref:SDR family NAD(P)-dependent oxidoreductase n=1 Tax=Actinophytocola sp. TaxID=1872138 RepID=UPI002ED2AC82